MRNLINFTFFDAIFMKICKFSCLQHVTLLGLLGGLERFGTAFLEDDLVVTLDDECVEALLESNVLEMINRTHLFHFRAGDGFTTGGVIFELLVGRLMAGRDGGRGFDNLII